ncbi:hypothetical protein ILYODFUR_015143 [Ilyodon furcidens]|uniref:Uncharacterized protein n=1 Tax=Ilyodon furcidens TaxID=33524 RepID=A0ABV0UHM3_9TELE
MASAGFWPSNFSLIEYNICAEGNGEASFREGVKEVQARLYLFLHLSVLPHDVVMCTHTPGGPLTAQRPPSAWVSSSHTPPWLPKERKRRKVSYRLLQIYSFLWVSVNAHSICPPANIKTCSSMTDGTCIN